MRVLVADDENSVREALRRALVLEGYDVDLASGGLEALTSVGSGRSDVMVLVRRSPGRPEQERT